MTNQDLIHQVDLDIKSPAPQEVDAGAAFALVLALKTPSGADLSGIPFAVADGDGKPVAEGVLPEIRHIDPDTDDYDPRHGGVDARDEAVVELTAPTEIGAYTWTLALEKAEIDGMVHAPTAIAFSFSVVAHRTSLTVWDTPAPVVCGTPFTVKVGATCSAGCDLGRCAFDILDEDGQEVGSGRFGPTPRQGTDALYWNEVTLRAPDAPGRRQWSAVLRTRPNAVAHGAARPAGFSLAVVPAGEHEVTVVILDEAEHRPVEKAYVRLGVFRGATDAAGKVRFTVPAGEHRLFVWKSLHEIPERRVKITRKRSIRLFARVLPEPDPYAFWTRG